MVTSCLFGDGHEYACNAHGGFYSGPLDDGEPRTKDGYTWRPCTIERRYCVHGDVRLRRELMPAGQIEMELYEQVKESVQ